MRRQQRTNFPVNKLVMLQRGEREIDARRCCAASAAAAITSSSSISQGDVKNSGQRSLSLSPSPPGPLQGSPKEI